MMHGICPVRNQQGNTHHQALQPTYFLWFTPNVGAVAPLDCSLRAWVPLKPLAAGEMHLHAFGAPYNCAWNGYRWAELYILY